MSAEFRECPWCGKSFEPFRKLRTVCHECQSLNHAQRHALLKRRTRETVDLGRGIGRSVLKVQPFDDMVAYAAMFAGDASEPLETGDGAYVLRPHSDAFPDCPVPLVVMEYPRLIRIMHDLLESRR